MDQLAGLAPGSPSFDVRRQRPDVVRHMQGSDDAIFSPQDDGGLSRSERAAAALRVATVLRDRTLQEHYGARLAAIAEATPPANVDPRWTAVVAHIDRVTADPESATRGNIDDLLAAGLSPHAVLSLSQLIAYVNFQSRVLAGLRMLGGAS
jgi:uncharacterized protein YciW